MKNKAVSYVFSISLIIVLFLSVIDLCCFDRAFYQREHRKLTLYDTPLAEYIGTDDEGLDHMTDVLLDYLKDKDRTLDLQMEIKGQMREIFTDDEKAHMVDVRELYLTAVMVRNVLLFVSVMSFAYLLWQEREKTFCYISGAYNRTLGITAIVLAALGVAIVSNFDAFWTSFHHVFFRNDLWLLDLAKDILIMIVPPQFFNDLVIRIFITVVVTLLAFMGLFIFLRRRNEE